MIQNLEWAAWARLAIWLELCTQSSKRVDSFPRAVSRILVPFCEHRGGLGRCDLGTIEATLSGS